MIIEIIFIIVLLLLLALNIAIRIGYNSLKQEDNETRLSGFEVANKMVDDDIHIIKKQGKFLDHYNSERKVIKLSPEVFDGTDMYAAAVAISLALETKRKEGFLTEKLIAFLVIASYILLVIGAFANNNSIIHFGLIIFIIAFILETYKVLSFAKTEEDMENVYKYIKKQKVIKPFEEEKDACLLGFLTRLATLPYSFINYFR